MFQWFHCFIGFSGAMMKFIFSGGKHLIQIDISHLQWSAEMGGNQQRMRKSLCLFCCCCRIKNILSTLRSQMQDNKQPTNGNYRCHIIDILKICINNHEIEMTLKRTNCFYIAMTFIITVKLSLAFILLFSLIYCFFIHYLACLLELICVFLSLIHVFLIYWGNKTLPLVNPVGVWGQISTLQNKNEPLLFCVNGIISFLSLYVQVSVSIRASPFFPPPSEGRCGCLLVFLIFLGARMHLREYKERKIEGLTKKNCHYMNEEAFCFSQRAP